MRACPAVVEEVHAAAVASVAVVAADAVAAVGEAAVDPVAAAVAEAGGSHEKI